MKYYLLDVRSFRSWSEANKFRIDCTMTYIVVFIISFGRQLKTILTHTGKIYVDTEHKLEFLTVGDYGKENNIKANFLGLTE